MNQHLLTLLEAFAISFSAGVAGYYASKALDGYLAHRTVKKRKAALDQTKAHLDLIHKLISSDRAAIVFGFGVLCLLVGFIAFGEFVAQLLAVLGGAGVSWPLTTMIWGIVAVLALYFAYFFKELDRPDETVAKLQAKISDLTGSPPSDGAA
jgi:hypothetical protein